MKIIFLDDDHQRWYQFQSQVPQAFRAETAEECIKMIEDRPDIDWLFLDHDLGGEAYVNSSREDCGMEVVRYLCEDPRTKSIKNIVVHSYNVVAAAEMYKKLQETGYNVKLVPFYNLIQAIKFKPEKD
jgi:CheY-like chemotaxis protein